MLYVDSSALVSRYAPLEPTHETALELMGNHANWGTGRLTLVEVPRALHRTGGSRHDVLNSIAAFDSDLAGMFLVDLDLATIAMARDIAIETSAKALDAIHLACALRVADGDLAFLTFDRAQARAAEALGLRLAH